MKVKDLKNLLDGWSQDAEIVLCGYDRKSGKSVLQDTHRCCNFEYQNKVNEIWLSMEGLKRG